MQRTCFLAQQIQQSHVYDAEHDVTCDVCALRRCDVITHRHELLRLCKQQQQQ